MSINLILGPMFSGKTTELMRLGRRHELAKKHVIYVKHGLDYSRYNSKNQICTHDGNLSGPERVVLLCNDLSEMMDRLTTDWVHVICIDEGQFFPDLQHSICELAALGKFVIVAALNGTYKQTIFTSIAEILPHAESVLWLTAVCFDCGNDNAQFTFRLVKDLEENV